MRTSAHWATINEYGSRFALNVTIWLYRYCGRRLLQHAVVPIVIAYYWLFHPSVRHHSLDYLQRLHHYFQANSPLPKKPNAWMAYRHLLAFGRSFVDKFAAWMGDMTAEMLQLHGHEHFSAHYGKGTIILTSHFGNIEVLRAIKTDHHQRVNILVYTRHAEQFNRMLVQLNPQASVRLICVDQMNIHTAANLEEKLAAGEWLMIAADRTPLHSARTSTVNFLGGSSHWPQGAWLLANMFKCPILAVFCYPYQQHYHVHIHKLSEQAAWRRHERALKITHHIQEYAAIMETHCLRNPWQWFNFYPFWRISGNDHNRLDTPET